MAEYAIHREEPRHVETAAENVASPAPLGLGLIGILTAIIGCFYTGFIIPFGTVAMRTGVGAALLIGGIILVLAGMWEFRKGYMMTATTFTSYGGFLSILGLVFLPGTGIATGMGGATHLFMGLLFLCWTIYLGVLCLGALRNNPALAGTLALLFVAFLFLMLGSLANNNGVLLRIGGWVAIASALVAWLSSLASILGAGTGHEATRTPLTDRFAVVE